MNEFVMLLQDSGLNFDAVSVGAILSDYQRIRVENVQVLTVNNAARIYHFALFLAIKARITSRSVSHCGDGFCKLFS
jgi:hypothetical protein